MGWGINVTEIRSKDREFGEVDMNRLALCVEYDGSAFHGWQVQKDTKTVQGVLEKALGKVADESIRVVTAGRTDTGVHATGQVAHFQTTCLRSSDAWLRGTNTCLDRSVAVLWVKQVPDSFHARFSALSRAYRYVVLNRKARPTFLKSRVTWDHRPLDIDRMRAASSFLLGRHDFNAYRAAACQAKQSVRLINLLNIFRQGDWIWIDIDADGFLHHMVRNIVGVLSAIGAGEAESEWAKTVLDSRDRKLGGVTAPPDGLYFRQVTYPVEFDLPPSPPACRFW